MNTVFEALTERGFVEQASDVDIGRWLAEKRVTVYAGFDPTADSLHLGHLVPIMALSHFQRYGHQVLAIIGGATGMIGDPSGRSDERNLLTPAQVAHNASGLRHQMERFLRFSGDNAAVMLDNNDWISRMSFIDWLREVGKYFSVNSMLAKDSVARRLSNETGITYTEFSYMTMQAYDFLHLFDKHDCRLQCGGNDQWGNITAGIELIRKLRGQPCYGLTFPLMTTSGGEKFGKSADNAIWLDARRTSPWDLYQYLIRQDDRDVIRFLKIYTFEPLERIAELEMALRTEPEKREAHRTLAFEVTRLVHGDNIANDMQRAAQAIYATEIRNMSDSMLDTVFAAAPSTHVTWTELAAGLDIVGLLTRTGLASSRSDARRLLKGGGIHVNNVRVQEGLQITSEHLASESYIVMRSGKKDYHLLKIMKE